MTHDSSALHDLSTSHDLSGLHVLLSAAKVGRFSALDLARMAVEGGAKVVQLREKSMPTGELLPIAREMRRICTDIRFIVNDRLDIARAVGADGVHLGQSDLPIDIARSLMPEGIFGISCGTVEEAVDAERSGADYIGFGHMYPTNSKAKPSAPRTLDELRSACAAVSIPVIAIGGITATNARPLLEAGASGIAVIGAFQNAEDPLEAAKQLVHTVLAHTVSVHTVQRPTTSASRSR